MKIDVSGLSYEQVKRLALSLPTGVGGIALAGNRVMMELSSPVA